MPESHLFKCTDWSPIQVISWTVLADLDWSYPFDIKKDSPNQAIVTYDRVKVILSATGVSHQINTCIFIMLTKHPHLIKTHFCKHRVLINDVMGGHCGIKLSTDKSRVGLAMSNKICSYMVLVKSSLVMLTFCPKSYRHISLVSI